MRIALVIERMDLNRGGREISIAQMASSLSRRGHEVTILCQSGSWASDGVTVQQLGRRGLNKVQRLANFVRAVRDTIDGGRFDIVHATLPIPGANVYQPRGGTIPGQIAGSARRWGPLGPLRKLLGPVNAHRRLMAKLEQQVLCDPNVLCLAVSQMVAEEFKTHYRRQQRVRVIYNAVDVPNVDAEQVAHWRQRRRYLLGVAGDNPVFLTIARNFGLKGVADTISAFAKWFHSYHGRINGRLVVIGRQNPENYLRHASLRDIGPCVLFVAPTDDIFQWYSAADACILLSWYDPCSRVVLEAVRWGVPAITTVFNGAAEILSTAGAGLVVSSPRDTRAVVAAMDELTDPATRSAHAQQCVQTADALSMDRHVDELLGAYAEIRKPK